MVWLAPRAPGDSVRPRLLSGLVGRPLNFTVRSRVLSRLTLLLVLWVAFGAACSQPLPNVRDGDVIFQTSRSSQSLAIQRATHSRFSHMGLIFIWSGEPYVLKAAATVRYTPDGETVHNAFFDRDFAP